MRIFLLIDKIECDVKLMRENEVLEEIRELNYNVKNLKEAFLEVEKHDDLDIKEYIVKSEIIRIK